MTGRRLRVAAAILILAGLGFFAFQLTPIYIRNQQLQRYVSDLTQAADAATLSDDILRDRVLQKAAELGLPVQASNVLIKRSNAGVRVEARYFVRVDLPLYTVDLHFYPGAGSR